MKKKLLFYLLCCLSLNLSFMSCSEDREDVKTFSLSKKDLTKSGNSIQLKIAEKNNIKTPRTGEVVLDFGSAGKGHVGIVQMGLGSLLKLKAPNGSDLKLTLLQKVKSSGASIEFTLITNLSYKEEYYLLDKDNKETKIEELPDWLDPIPLGEKENGPFDKPFSYQVREYDNIVQRGVLIRFIEDNVQDGANPKIAEYRLIQEAFKPEPVEDKPDEYADTKIKIVGANANQHEGSDVIKNSYDGIRSTIYHSPWSSQQTRFPVLLTYNFEKVETIDYLQYVPRSGNENGNFEKVDLLISDDGSTYKKVDTYDFNGSGNARKIFFDKPIKAKYVRFKVLSGKNGFAACAEMEFYQKNANQFKVETLFKDEMATRLKDGITMDEIKACKDPIFRQLALELYNNVYEKEFRIAEFKAYPNAALQGNSNRTNAYSFRENPTGLLVEKGQRLIVFVGDTYGFDRLGIQVQGLYPNADKSNEKEGYGYGGQSYSLHKGFNQIKIEKKGLIYVNYYFDSLREAAAAKPIKFHFVGAKVNGYFDSQNPKHEGRWKELLDKAVDENFDVIGKYAHLTFPTQVFKDVTYDGKKLIDSWDKIVKSEMELLGLFKYNKVFKNHMYCNVAYHGYMYATWGHTAYSYGTNAGILDPNNFGPRGSVWGPAHEIGHMNQTRPGVKWIGMTEVTNNIMSQYVKKSVFKQSSRLQVEDVLWGNNRYTKAWNSLLTHELPLSILSIDPVKEVSKLPAKYKDGGAAKPGLLKDVFCQLVPFWQLQLYFGNVKGMTPDQQSDKGGFYPEVYEQARKLGDKYLGTKPNGDHQGVYQTDFAYIASKAAGYDLTDFFVKWGFLREMPRTEIDDYSKAYINIPKSRVDEIKQMIKGLGLPKLDVPIEYITDRTWKFFKDDKHVVKGRRAYWSGKDLIIEGWQNVVAYEVWDKPYGTSGAKLLYVGDGYKASDTSKATCAVVKDFIRNRGGNPDAKPYVYAVDVNNKRILAGL